MTRSLRKTRAQRCASTGHRWTKSPDPDHNGLVRKECRRCGTVEVGFQITPRLVLTDAQIAKISAAILAYDADPYNLRRRPR